jgi:hypothetical protein
MQTIIKNNVIYNKEKALTLLELAVVCVVFSLFLVGIYATLDIGLKSWQLGETRTDLHQRAEILLNRIVREFTYSTSFSVQIEHNGDPNNINKYLCFETAVNKNSNNFTDDIASGSIGRGCPVWQGHILYYLAPDPDNSRIKNVYRAFVPNSAPAIQPSRLTSIGSYINITSGENVRTVVKDIYNLNFVLQGNILLINISFQKHIRSHASVAFSPGADASKGTEVISMKAVTKAKN